MDKNYNNHIMSNTCRAHDRGMQGRMENENAHLEHILQEDCNKHICNSCEIKCKNEHGGEVYCANIGNVTMKNNNFRESVWTGRYLQMTLMSIPCGEDIGVENHYDTDQYIRVENGCAMAFTGKNRDELSNKCRLNSGEAIFIPAGTWHNIVNIGRRNLKLSSIYAPPHHPRCTVEKIKNE